MSGEIILYQTEDGATIVQLQARDGNAWLTQAQLAELFQATKQNISLHIRNILDDGEQDERAVVKEYLTTATDGKNYKTQYYSLPMILAVGFRVRSPRGLQLRRWATEVLSEYLVKGFVMDDARLKNPDADYFEELLARIRDKVLDTSPPAWTTIPGRKARSASFRPFRTRCIMPPTAIRLPRLFIRAPMRQRTIWGSLHGQPPAKVAHPPGAMP